MDDAIARIIQASAVLDPAERPSFIFYLMGFAAAVRELDAVPKDQTPDPELLAWFSGVRNA
jgi:hypothetical protein